MVCDGAGSTGLFCNAELDDALKCSTYPTCPKSDGSAENAADCSCGTSSCLSSNGKFCNAASNACAKFPIPNCAKTDGSAANSAACACVSKICDSAESTGLFCNTELNDATKCSKYPSCSKTDGAFVNSGRCFCDTVDCVDAGSTGLFCNTEFGDATKCSKYPSCSKKNGASGANPGRCFCGSVECVSAESTGLFCHESEGVCTKSDTVCGTNEHVASNKCVRCENGHKYAGDNPLGDDTACISDTSLVVTSGADACKLVTDDTTKL